MAEAAECQSVVSAPNRSRRPSDDMTLSTAPIPGPTRPARWQRWQRWQRWRFPLLAVIVLVISSIPPLERMRLVGFISDDASWQVALSTWRPWDGDLILPENTYVLHMPAFIVANLVLPASPWSIFVVALVLHAVGLFLIVDFARRSVAQVTRVGVTELRWWQDLLTVGAVAAYQLAIPITRNANAGVATRNLEAGLYLLAIRIGFQIVSGRRQPTGVRQWALVSAAVVTLGINDPLSLITLVVPTVGLTAVGIGWRRVRRADPDPAWGRARSLAVAASIGIVGWVGIKLALPLIGVRQRSNGATEFAALGDVRHHVPVVARGVSDMIGGGLGSDPSLAVRVVGGLLTVAAIGGFVAVAAFVRRARRSDSRFGVPWLAVLAACWLGLTALTYAMSTSGASLEPFRYVLVAAPAVGVVVATGAVCAPPASRMALGALALVSVLFVAPIGIARDHTDVETLFPDVADHVGQLADLGYARGYSGYWTSSIVTLLSNGRAPVLPMQCAVGGRSVPHQWLVDMGQFDRAVADPADRTFIVLDRRDGFRLTCPEWALREQHGSPSDVVVVSPDIHIWLYPDRDVVAEVSGSPPG